MRKLIGSILKVSILSIFLFGSTGLYAKDIGSASLVSEVKKSERMSDAKSLVTKAKGKTLVVFDIDDTLLTSESFFGSDYWYEWQSGLKKGDPGYVPCKFDILALNFEMGTQRAVEPEAVEIVKAITADKLYLTARNPASRGATLRELGRAGYPLPRAISASADGVMFTWKDPITAREAVVSYHAGVYMVSGLGKGEALIELLRRAGKSYENVILVDDGEKNILSMKDALKKRGISYYGFHYLRVGKSLPPYREMIDASNQTWEALRNHLRQYSPGRLADIESERCSY
jgi:FMN phosphatase YigB (HAD superfamily)